MEMKTVESFDAAIALLQDQVLDLQMRIRELQSRRNSLSPLYRLPDEILLYIIEGLAGSYQYDPLLPLFSSAYDGIDITHKTPAGWSPIMGVCTRMRSLALQNVHIWAHINLNSHENWV